MRSEKEHCGPVAGSPDLPRAVTHALEYSNQVSNIFMPIYLLIYLRIYLRCIHSGPRVRRAVQ